MKSKRDTSPNKYSVEQAENENLYWKRQKYTLSESNELNLYVYVF